MTEREIIKAMECCNGWDGRCLNCPLNREGTNCKEKLNSYALDLINRQNAEIEMLQKNIDGLNIFTKNHITVIRLQAIQEFADRLKERLTGIGRSTTYGNFEYGTIKSYELDNIVKEITEVEINQRKEDEGNERIDKKL